MKNRTIANWLMVAVGVCFLGDIVASETQSLIYFLGGAGVIVFTIMAIIRLFKINRNDWLAYVLAIDFGLYLLLAVMSLTNDPIAGLLVIIYWVFGIWTIIRLYHAAELKVSVK